MSDGRRGWSAQGLPALGDDPRFWTAEEAAALLGPPVLSVTQVRGLIRVADLQPAGRRKARASGRYARVYRAEELIRLFDAVYSVVGA